MKKQAEQQEIWDRDTWMHFDKCIEWVQYTAARFASIPHIGLTHAEFAMLQRMEYLCQRQNAQAIAVGQLVVEGMQSKSAVSKMLGSMEKKRLVTRQVSPQNRRNVLVSMTPEGRRLYDLNDAVAQRLAVQTTEQLGREKVVETMSMMMRCAEAYEKNLREGMAQARALYEAGEKPAECS